MRNEHTANQALEDYNAKEYAMRQAWAKVLTAPVRPRQAKPVAKQSFFSRFFKAV